MEKYEQLKQVIMECEEDFTKLYEKGVKAASTRIRKAMQTVKALAQEIRVDAQATKDELSKKGDE